VAVDVGRCLHRHIRMVRSVRDEIPVVVITGGDDRVAARILVPVVVVNEVFAAASFGICHSSTLFDGVPIGAGLRRSSRSRGSRCGRRRSGRRWRRWRRCRRRSGRRGGGGGGVRGWGGWGAWGGERRG